MEPTPTDATSETPADTLTDGTPTAAATAPVASLPTNVPPETDRLGTAPPLAAVAAVSGLLATLLVRLLIPSRDESGSVVGWEIVARVGAFAVNLAAIASMVALVLGLWPWLRGDVAVNPRRRLLIASFGGMLLPVWARAVFFPRDAMNGALVSLGAAAACSLSILLVVGALRGARGRSVPWLPIVLSTLATLSSLALLTLQSLSLVAPFSRVHGLAWIVADVGESAYLGVMLCAIALMPRGPWTPRKVMSLASGGVVALGIVVAFQIAVSALSREFAIALYYAQHVTLFLDGALWAYAVPLAVGMGGATAAILGNDARARQLGIAVLCWIAAGNSARAPWRYTLLVLSACLAARAVTSSIAALAPTSAEQAR